MLTDKYLHEMHVPTEVIGCKNINCSDENHVRAVNKMYSDKVSSLLHAGEQTTHKNKKNYVHKPGWAEYVDDLYDVSRETRDMWMYAGKSRQGPIFGLHVKNKARFKYALRFIKNNENMLHKEALAKKLADLKTNAFWREITTTKNCNAPLPSLIEGVSGGKEIVDLLRNVFSGLLMMSITACECNCDTSYEDLEVSAGEVTHMIKKLNVNKACGSVGVYSEHIKYASNILVPLLSMSFTSCVSHGFLP